MCTQSFPRAITKEKLYSSIRWTDSSGASTRLERESEEDAEWQSPQCHSHANNEEDGGIERGAASALLLRLLGPTCSALPASRPTPASTPARIVAPGC